MRKLNNNEMKMMGNTHIVSKYMKYMSLNTK